MVVRPGVGTLWLCLCQRLAIESITFAPKREAGWGHLGSKKVICFSSLIIGKVVIIYYI
jgi:hypothetical protein